MPDQVREDTGAEVVECEGCEGRGWSTVSTYKSGRPSKQREPCRTCRATGSVPAPSVVGSGVVNVVEALRRGAERPKTAYGWVHAGPGLLEEAADRIERLEAAPLVEDEQEGLRERLRLDLSGVKATPPTDPPTR